MSNGTTFEDLYVKDWLICQCTKIAIKHPTCVQAACIPPIIGGKHCVGISETGSGKTLAFALPILHHLSNNPYGVFALVLTVTRELAFQITDQFEIIGKPFNLKVCTIVGGGDIVRQRQELEERPHIVVATPGRLAHLIESCSTSSLAKIRYLVSDEADRLLSGIFDQQLAVILRILPKNKQNLFFSATMDDDTLKDISESLGNNGDMFIWTAPREVATVSTLTQQYAVCPVNAREPCVVEILRLYRIKDEDGSVIVFVDSCVRCQVLSMLLNEVGFENVPLHSLMKQSERQASLSRFKSKLTKMLVATDIVGRGLDVPSVQLVVNFTLPKVPNDYIHRVGRTARANRPGSAISIINIHEVPLLQSIEQAINVQLTEFEMDVQKVVEIYSQVKMAIVKAKLDLTEQGFFENKYTNNRKKWISQGLDPDEELRKILINRQSRQNIKRKSKTKKGSVKCNPLNKKIENSGSSNDTKIINSIGNSKSKQKNKLMKKEKTMNELVPSVDT